MPENLSPPDGWNQRVKRALPFVPGRDGGRFEIHVVDRPGERRRVFDLNLSSGEVFERRPDDRFDAPAWLELPAEIRRAVRLALDPREERFPR